MRALMPWLPVGLAKVLMTETDLAFKIQHHFAGGVYMRQQELVAGGEVEKHEHPYDHLSYLVSGSAIVSVGDEIAHLEGPCALEVKAGVKHHIRAITDIVWLCIHAEAVADPEIIKE
jgi:quercetin dioxygenase-like cupin family protein